VKILSPIKTPKKLAAFFFFASSSVLMAQSGRAYESGGDFSSFFEPKLAIPALILVAIYYIRPFKNDGNKSVVELFKGMDFIERCNFLANAFLVYMLAVLAVGIAWAIFSAIFG
jgi:hypothetical protein